MKFIYILKGGRIPTEVSGVSIATFLIKNINCYKLFLEFWEWTHRGKLIIQFPAKFQIKLLENKDEILKIVTSHNIILTPKYGIMRFFKLRLYFSIDLSEIWSGIR